VKEKLKNQRFLVIIDNLDNMDDISDIRSFFPLSNTGYILITRYVYFLYDWIHNIEALILLLVVISTQLI
jgi:hypothetical protein